MNVDECSPTGVLFWDFCISENQRSAKNSEFVFDGGSVLDLHAIYIWKRESNRATGHKRSRLVLGVQKVRESISNVTPPRSAVSYVRTNTSLAAKGGCSCTSKDPSLILAAYE